MCREGGCFDVVVFCNAIFSKSDHFLAKHTEFGRIFSSITYLIHFFFCLDVLANVYKRRLPLLSAVQLICTFKAYLCCFTQYTVDQSKLTVNGSALSDTPNVRYLVALYNV